MQIALVIATTGRPGIVAQTLDRLAAQTRRPDRLLVVGAAAEDFPERRAFGRLDAEYVIGPKGSSRQRNAALDRLGCGCDLVLFLDDDFVAARDFVAGAERLMLDRPDVVGASGKVLADGFRSAGVSFAEADRLIMQHEAAGAAPVRDVEQVGMYGCNMIVRVAASPTARFDENLPLFGWLEDLDFSMAYKRVGRIVETDRCVGVHLGVKVGRTPGLLLGYSQIANPIYLARKEVMSWRRAVSMGVRNLVANALRSVAPESYIDRRGRLRGNLVALADIGMGRCHPTRILALRSPPAPAKAFAARSGMV